MLSLNINIAVSVIFTFNGPFWINLNGMRKNNILTINTYLNILCHIMKKKIFPHWFIIRLLFPKFIDVSFFLEFQINSIIGTSILMTVLHYTEYFNIAVKFQRGEL